jgi:hypothetical protein
MNKKIFTACAGLAASIGIGLYIGGGVPGFQIIATLAGFLVVGLITWTRLGNQPLAVVYRCIVGATLLFIVAIGAVYLCSITIDNLMRFGGKGLAALGAFANGGLTGFWWGSVKKWLDIKNSHNETPREKQCSAAQER